MGRASRIIILLVGFMGSARAGVITISELLYDAVGPDDGFTFVEIYGPPGMLLASRNLSKWIESAPMPLLCSTSMAASIMPGGPHR